jgi:glycosyltransferase involved in cell wall biosynthesis
MEKVDSMENKHFDVSVIMPVFNELRTITNAVQDVLKLKQHLNLELIVVDNCSTDGTSELLSDLKNTLDFELILGAFPQGKGVAVKGGLEKAQGAIISIIDADNEYTIPNLIEIINFMKMNNLRFALGARPRNTEGHRGIRSLENSPITTFYYNFGHTIFTAFFNALFKTRLKDPATMWKVFYRNDIDRYSFTGKRFEFDWELLALLIRKGHIPAEVSIEYTSRNHKQGKKIRPFRDPVMWSFCIIYYRFKTLEDHSK